MRALSFERHAGLPQWRMPPRRAENKDALPAWPPVLSFPTVGPDKTLQQRCVRCFMSSMRAPPCDHSPGPNSRRSWSKPAKKRQAWLDRNAPLQGWKLYAETRRREGSRDGTRQNHRARRPAQMSSRPLARDLGGALLSQLDHGIPRSGGPQCRENARVYRFHEYSAHRSRIHW
jgi:hypothetical protein